MSTKGNLKKEQESFGSFLGQKYDSDSSESYGVEEGKGEILGPLIKEFKKIMIEGKGSEPVNGYIIPNYDAHLNEYLPASEQRLAFLTGFTGSVGTAIILNRVAAFWTDSRFYSQALEELEEGWVIYRLGDPDAMSEVDFIRNNLNPGETIGADAKLMPYPIWLSMKKELKQYDVKLIHVSSNLVDVLWGEMKPQPSLNPIQSLGSEYSGRTIESKLEEIRTKMEEKMADVLIVTRLDDIAWTLNLRGTDIPYCPVFLAFMVISMKTVDIFTDKRRIQYKAAIQLIQEQIDVRFLNYERIYEFLKYIANFPLVSKIWLEPTASYYIYNVIPSGKRILDASPIERMKCVKSPEEVKFMEQAHIKDGVALTQFFHWLEEQTNSSGVTELEAAEKLDSFREMEYAYMGRSFPTFSASGPHSAILNYIPNTNSSHVITKEEIYLIDAGAQYVDGTTDVARTVIYGEPTDFMVDCYTRVFKGLVAVSTQIFPKGIPGKALDTLARKCLWDVGLNYHHGSGHGIGCFLYAHESPIGIAWKPFPEEMGLLPDMFLTIEPGCYSEEEFGIRIENVVRTVEVETKYNFNEAFLTFETVTLCPIQTKLLDQTILTDKELKFLNSYHVKIKEMLTPVLSARFLNVELDWLTTNCKPFGSVEDDEKKGDEDDK